MHLYILNRMRPIMFLYVPFREILQFFRFNDISAVISLTLFSVLSNFGTKIGHWIPEYKFATRRNWVWTRGPKKDPNIGELKSPSHRFRSPVSTAKKRSFWDITAANSPSVTTLNGRKTRSHVISELTGHPSMLLQVEWFFTVFLKSYA